MPLFQYKAVSPAGQVQEGVLDGPSQAAVIERLQQMGLIPIRAAEARPGQRAPATAAPGKPLFASLFSARKVTQDQLTVLTREIDTLLRAGLPLDRSLEILLDLTENGQVHELLTQIRNEVRGGAALSKALEKRRDVFSRFYVNMVKAGEAGGQLAGVLKRLADHMEAGKELKDTILSALVYPVILLLVASASVTVMFLFVVPQFKEIFSKAGQTLPLVTQVVILIGDLLRGYWWLLLAAVVLAGYWFFRSMAQAESRRGWDRRFLTLPLVGDLIAKIETARFARTLATLTSNGVPLLAALGIVRETLGNVILAEAVARATGELKEGRGLAKPMQETGSFPKLAVQMIGVGEETGRLDEMLLQVASTYDGEVRNAVKRLLSLVEPVMLLGMAAVVCLIIVALGLPMMQMFKLQF